MYETLILFWHTVAHNGKRIMGYGRANSLFYIWVFICLCDEFGFRTTYIQIERNWKELHENIILMQLNCLFDLLLGCAHIFTIISCGTLELMRIYHLSRMGSAINFYHEKTTQRHFLFLYLIIFYATKEE